MEKIAVLAPMPSASERMATAETSWRRAHLAYRQPHVVHVSGGHVPGARPFRYFEEGGGVQRVEGAGSRLGLACATCQRGGMQFSKVTGKLLDDVGRQLTPFAIGALADQLSPLAQGTITHARLRRVRE